MISTLRLSPALIFDLRLLKPVHPAARPALSAAGLRHGQCAIGHGEAQAACGACAPVGSALVGQACRAPASELPRPPSAIRLRSQAGLASQPAVHRQQPRAQPAAAADTNAHELSGLPGAPANNRLAQRHRRHASAALGQQCWTPASAPGRRAGAKLARVAQPGVPGAGSPPIAPPVRARRQHIRGLAMAIGPRWRVPHAAG